MSTTEMPAALAREAVETADDIRAATRRRIETLLAVLFTGAAVLFVSFLTVAMGLV
jgi:hypothetical protein